MSGTPTEAQIRTQLTNALTILEGIRNHADGTVAGQLDTLYQSLNGEYTPQGMTEAGGGMRAALSALISPEQAAAVLGPIVLEYSHRIGKGGGYADLDLLLGALYEHFHDNSLTVQTRNIGYDTTATRGASNVGGSSAAGEISRVTKDWYDYPLEACHAETKKFVCIADQNTGVRKHAEIFEVVGEAQSFDNLLISATYDATPTPDIRFGSGSRSRAQIRSHHAGAGAGGSLLTNSSWSTYSASATPKFNGWTESAGGAQLSQNTSAYYRSFPNATTDASLQITASGSTTVTIKQTLANMRLSRFQDRPYALRIMVNKTVGSAVGGSVTLKLGSTTQSWTIASIGANWQELVLDFDKDLWFQNFNEADLDVEITWAQSTSTGYLLVDDAILAPMDLIDGTWWFMRQNENTSTSDATTPWKIDDELTFTDTAGQAGTGKINWWWWRAGYGYLPASSSPTTGLADSDLT